VGLALRDLRRSGRRRSCCPINHNDDVELLVLAVLVGAFILCRARDAANYGSPATQWERLANLKAAPMSGLSWTFLVGTLLVAAILYGS
jgi:hypothetical protein